MNYIALVSKSDETEKQNGNKKFDINDQYE